MLDREGQQTGEGTGEEHKTRVETSLGVLSVLTQIHASDNTFNGTKKESTHEKTVVGVNGT